MLKSLSVVLTTRVVSSTNVISNKRMNDINFVCLSVVSNMFSDFINPKFRGPEFSWAGFPEMVSRFCVSQVYLSCSWAFDIKSEKQRAEIDKYSQESAMRYAKQFVKNAGLSD